MGELECSNAILDTNRVHQFCASARAPDGETDIKTKNIIFYLNQFTVIKQASKTPGNSDILKVLLLHTIYNTTGLAILPLKVQAHF